MLDVCLLGTGGMMPIPRRWLTSLMCRYNGSNILIDCGEGTQVAVKQKGWTFKPIDVICITHYHADHISGLPGLLLTMGNAERKKPLTMIGPKGLERVVKALRTIAPELPFDIKFIELSEDLETIQFEEYKIKAFKVKHSITCYGYSIEVDRSGKFDATKAKELDMILIPYEEAKNMVYTREIISKIEPGMSVGIFIGSEGGFSKEEVQTAKDNGAEEITLGKRILRTETAGMTVMAVLMYLMEE